MESVEEVDDPTISPPEWEAVGVDKMFTALKAHAAIVPVVHRRKCWASIGPKIRAKVLRRFRGKTYRVSRQFLRNHAWCCRKHVT